MPSTYIKFIPLETVNQVQIGEAFHITPFVMWAQPRPDALQVVEDNGIPPAFTRLVPSWLEFSPVGNGTRDWFTRACKSVLSDYDRSPTPLRNQTLEDWMTLPLFQGFGNVFLRQACNLRRKPPMTIAVYRINEHACLWTIAPEGCDKE